MKNLVCSFKKSCTELLFEVSLIGTRFTLALAEFIWAITLFWEGDTFERPTYTAMSNVMSENQWGIVFLLTSIIQWIILICKKFHTLPSVLFAAYNAFLWWYVCIGMYTSLDSLPAAISGETALAFAASWVFIRSGIISGSTIDNARKYK